MTHAVTNYVFYTLIHLHTSVSTDDNLTTIRVAVTTHIRTNYIIFILNQIYYDSHKHGIKICSVYFKSMQVTILKDNDNTNYQSFIVTLMSQIKEKYAKEQQMFERHFFIKN